VITRLAGGRRGEHAELGAAYPLAGVQEAFRQEEAEVTADPVLAEG
jgi:hypothetical protein